MSQIPACSPIISIVIPLYCKEKEVERALQSVMAQTFHNFEVIIVNDGSTDGSRASVERFLKRVGESENRRIRIIDQANQGVAAARNRGIAAARAEMVAFLDADDEWMPEFLETIMRLRRTFPECDVFATSYYVKALADGVMVPRCRGLPAAPWEGIVDRYFKVAATSDPILCSSATAVSIKALTDIGGFPIGIRSGEDLLTWARLAFHYRLACSRTACAVIYPPSVRGEPPRPPQIPDIVGAELSALAAQCRGKLRQDLLGYAALWHRMRANCYLRIGKRLEARQETRQAAELKLWHIKTIAYFLIALAPFALKRFLYHR